MVSPQQCSENPEGIRCDSPAPIFCSPLGETVLSILFLRQWSWISYLVDKFDDLLSRITFKAYNENADDLSPAAQITAPAKDIFQASALWELLRRIDLFQSRNGLCLHPLCASSSSLRGLKMQFLMAHCHDASFEQTFITETLESSTGNFSSSWLSKPLSFSFKTFWGFQNCQSILGGELNFLGWVAEMKSWVTAI